MLTNAPLTPVAGDLDRRWISDEYFDLIVWYEPDQQIHGFQLCYDKQAHECALTWTRERGFLHTAIDDGESKPTANRTPILTIQGVFPAQQVRGEFVARSESLPVEICQLVLARIDDYHHRQST